MNQFTQKIRTFLRDEEGLTMTEYAVAGALITVTAAAAFTELGNAIATTIRDLIGRMSG